MTTSAATFPSAAGSPVESVLEATATLRSELLRHPLYTAIHSPQQLRIFMQHHAFAVYDFMWLLKRLQSEICSAQLPWVPPRFPELARFINEIVLAEESDDDGDGSFRSHFGLYLDAMEELGASTEDVQGLVNRLRQNSNVSAALSLADVPESVGNFVRFNWQLASQGSIAEVAAVFCFGREDIIPEMFQRLMDGFLEHGISVPRLQYYIQRHIELDGDHHGPLARQLVNQLCGDSQAQLAQIIAAAQQAITLRIALWDGVLKACGGDGGRQVG